jgi:hypothetical protein
MQRPLVSSKTVILKIVRDLGLGTTEIPWQDLVEWIGEGLQHIGAYGQLLEKCEDLEVEGYRAKLPCDFYAARPNPHVVYKLQGDNLVVGFATGWVRNFAYLAVALDGEGFPLVPDHVSYATALFWKCAMQLAIRDELPNKKMDYATCVNRWNWYCRQAGTVGGSFGAEKAQRLADMFTARIPDLQQYETGFAQLRGEPEPLPAPPTNSPALGAVIPAHWVPTPFPS